MSYRTELAFSPLLVSGFPSQTLMNVQCTRTTAHLTQTARMLMEHSSVHARRDIQEMGKHAMAGSTVQGLQSKRQVKDGGKSKILVANSLGTAWCPRIVTF